MKTPSKLSMLKERAAMLADARAFFAERGVLEVDTPMLSHAAPIDTHIDVMEVLLSKDERGYLHTSPEYAMKRLLADGVGDIYQMGHVFRDGEIGALHNPEFTMVEWYRLGFSFLALIEETIAFIRLFLPNPPAATYSYRALLQEHTAVDYLKISREELAAKTLELVPHLPRDAKEWDRDTLLNCLMSFVVEPHLGKEELSIVREFPASQAALSRTRETTDGERVAMRFEVYFRGIELANGYHELTCPKEQRKRFEEANLRRSEMGKKPLPIDENLLSALEKGLPDCCGVAVGFDRLLMLRQEAADIASVLPLPWENS